MRKKTILGLLLGGIAGVLDVIPMVWQKLTWYANLSALSMWVVVGFLISATDLKGPAVAKGILIAFLVLLPSAILIGWKESVSLLPIGIMTIVLGGLLGVTIERMMKEI
jgi:hypothetical protein